MEQEMDKIRARFGDLSRRVPELLADGDDLQDSVASNSSDVALAKPRDDDTHYFDSYSYNGPFLAQLEPILNASIHRYTLHYDTG